LVFQFIFSLLLHSDKEDVIFNFEDKSKPYKPYNIDPQIVNKYKAKEFGKPETEMDRIRENIFSDAEKTIANIDLSNKILSLNVPTGTGKTLTALSISLQLQQRLKKQDRIPKIIYALPFTSIIDQNYQVINDILDDPGSNVLLKHHHLAEISYKANGLEFEPADSKFLIESWESQIVVTTFFQIFHTLLTNRNRMIQKFHKFANSIVLLDEVQAVPYKYWNLIREIMMKLSELFNVYFILITATQPQIFNDNEIKEIVPDRQKYFEKLDRVKIHFEAEPVTIEEYIKKCKKESIASNQSYLFVMNTIKSSIDLFNALKKLDLAAKYYYLSTSIIPKHRTKRIRDIRESKERKIIVSTQLIEAGVDIDIENVWRDFAPLESINQVCGRCNRNFHGKKGDVKIFQILDSSNKNKPYSSYIYGKTALSLRETREAFGNQSQISESDFLKNLDSYYTRIKCKMNDEESSHKNILFMRHLRFSDLYKSFKLIDDPNYARKDVFIEADNDAVNIWKKFAKLKQIDNFIDRRNEFLKFKKEFYDYVISVPVKYIEEEEFENTGFIYIKNSMIDIYYHETTG